MAGREGLSGAWELCQAAGLKPPEDRAGASRVWKLVFSSVSDHELVAAAVAHISDHKAGVWWPKPADLMRHVQAARSVEEVRRLAVESSQPPGVLLEDMDARRAERDERRRIQDQHRVTDERIQREREEREEQALADGLVYGPVSRKLCRYSLSKLEALGDCEGPRGEHLHWHQAQAMDACPYRSAVERRRRSSLTLVREPDEFTEALDEVIGGVAT